jgi:Zn-dependent protease with chaperone function
MSETLEGVWYDGTSSRAVPAQLHVDGTTTLRLTAAEAQHDATLGDVIIGARLGNAPRRMDFPNGGAFETSDNDAVDRLLRAAGKSSHTWLRALETNWQLLAAAAVILAAVAWGVFQYGIPAAAKTMAAIIPPSVLDSLGQQTLAGIDRIGLDETRLADARRAAIAARFDVVVAAAAMSDVTCRVEFRSAKTTFGPNAFALPPCVIILTDELVELAANDAELIAVIAHEVGHIKHRHSLRRIIQDTFLTFIFMLMSGDATQVSAAIAAAPALLLELGYARDFEREADVFAAAYMREANVPLHAFPDILERMERWHSKDECADGDCPALDKSTGRGGFLDYFSTHPATDERATLFEAEAAIAR